MAYLLARSPETPPTTTPAQAEAAAAASCRELARFDELVRANASADQARAVLAAGVRQAKAAAQGDPRWLSLAGGAQSLELALEADDARAARVGIDVVRTACRTTTAKR